MRPDFRILSNGVDITSNVRNRLIDIVVHDEAETKNDRVSIKIDDRPNEFGAHVALPTIGTTLDVALGYKETGLVPLGSYEVDSLGYSGPPDTLTVTAKAANMPSAFRSPTTRSWHGVTLGGIVEAIADEYGFTPKVDNALAAIEIAHEDQTAESPMAFASRIAERFDAVVRPVNGFLVLAPRGQARAVTGAELPTFVLTKDKVSGKASSWRYTWRTRTQPGKGGATSGAAKTVYWDQDEAELKEAVTGEGAAQALRFEAANAAEAKAASSTSANNRKRKQRTLQFTCPGDTGLFAEQKLILSGFREGIPVEWRVVSVEHRFSRSGYACSVEAELFNADQVNVAEAETAS